MKWNNLKNFECPDCSCKLQAHGIGYLCSNIDCSYFITKQVFDQVISDLYKPPKKRMDLENAEALNNLGTVRMSDEEPISENII